MADLRAPSQQQHKHQEQLHDENETSFTEDGSDDPQNCGKDQKNSRWPRMRWTDEKVTLLIQVVCYVQVECTNGNRKKSEKWKSVSNIMMKKGFSISPRQCEDKFNGLNKRYKRLNDLLGRGTLDKVVKNPALLNSIDISREEKEDVRKILSSTPFYYEEIRNYYSRLNIAADLGMQSSTSKSRDDHVAWGTMKDENGGDDEQNENNDEDGEDNYDGNDVRDARAEGIGSVHKRIKLSKESEEESYWTSDNLHDCMSSTAPDNLNPVMSGMLLDNARTTRMQPDGARTALMQREGTRISESQVKERKADLEKEAFEVEKMKLENERMALQLKHDRELERLNLENEKLKHDRELERLKLGNEKLKLRNERMALLLKQKELDIGSKFDM